jgi:hypothetical protein
MTICHEVVIIKPQAKGAEAIVAETRYVANVARPVPPEPFGVGFVERWVALGRDQVGASACRIRRHRTVGANRGAPTRNCRLSAC